MQPPSRDNPCKITCSSPATTRLHAPTTRLVCCATAALTVFQVRFRLIRLPVVRNPLSPMAPRHSIDNWPRAARPSRRRSFCKASRPSWRPSSCSTRKATCRTSRGFKVGGAVAESSEVIVSQLRDCDLNGALGFSRLCCNRVSPVFCFKDLNAGDAAIPSLPPHHPPHFLAVPPGQIEANGSFHMAPETCRPLPRAAILTLWSEH